MDANKVDNNDFENDLHDENSANGISINEDSATNNQTNGNHDTNGDSNGDLKEEAEDNNNENNIDIPDIAAGDDEGQHLDNNEDQEINSNATNDVEENN